MIDKQINAFAWSSHIDLYSLSFNLFLGFILGMILRWHFKKFSSVLSNRDELGQVLPILLITIILIISIVKSSLALSLGLVGALSIVRFRTPIKEPEELSYIFIAIAVGLGLGAGQSFAVIMSFFIIITAASIIKWQKRLDKSSTSYLIISWNNSNSVAKVEDITNYLSKLSTSIRLRKYDIRDDENEITYIIDLRDVSSLDSIIFHLKTKLKVDNITLFDQSTMPKI